MFQIDTMQGRFSVSSSSFPIDREHLSRQTMGDSDIEREVLIMFKDQARVVISRMRSAGSDDIAQIAHAIRGAASNIGAFALADCAEQIENNPLDADMIVTLERHIAEADHHIELILAS